MEFITGCTGLKILNQVLITKDRNRGARVQEYPLWIDGGEFLLVHDELGEYDVFLARAFVLIMTRFTAVVARDVFI